MFQGSSISSNCSNCKRKADKPIKVVVGENVNNSNNVNKLSTTPNTIPNGNSEPFYLHPPLNERTLETPHAPENGLYINPMNRNGHR